MSIFRREPAESVRCLPITPGPWVQGAFLARVFGPLPESPRPPLRTKQQQRYPKDGEKKEEAQAGQNSV